MNKSDLIVIRDYKPEDKNLIYSTWLKGLYHGDSWFSLMPKSIFMRNYHIIVERILTNAHIKIACLKEDADTVLGYSVCSQEAIHWVFVKKKWRAIGLARDLTPKNLKFVTHLTKTGLSIISKRQNLEFNPFLIK